MTKGALAIPEPSVGQTRVRAVLAVGAMCLCFGVVGFAWWSFAASLSPDSVTYLDMARSLAQGRGITHRWAYWQPVYQTGILPTPSTLWPPGYPLIVAALVLLGADPYVAAATICIVSFSLLPIPMYGLARLLLPPGRALICSSVAIVLAPIVELALGVQAEPPFLLCATFSLLCTVRALHAETPRQSAYLWLAASTTAGAAFLMRYVGVACVGAIGVAALFGRTTDVKSLATRIALAGGPAGLVVAAVFARNRYIAGALFAASPGSDRFWDTLWPSIRGIAGATVGSNELLGPHASLLRPLELVLLAGLTVLAVVAFSHERAWANNHRRRVPGGSPSLVILLFILLGMVVPIRTVASLGLSIESRYITIYLPWCFVLLLGWALRVGDHDTSASRGTHLRQCAYVACVLWVSCQAIVIGFLLSSRDEGFVAGGSHSPTIAWVRMNVPRSETVLTNRGPDLAYWAPNPILRLPRPPFAHGLTTWDEVDRLAAKVQARYLIHFLGSTETRKWDEPAGFRFLRLLDMPATFPERRPIIFPDGVVYRVGPPRAADHSVESFDAAGARPR